MDLKNTHFFILKYFVMWMHKEKQVTMQTTTFENMSSKFQMQLLL